jgi:hypothetical protein
MPPAVVADPLFDSLWALQPLLGCTLFQSWMLRKSSFTCHSKHTGLSLTMFSMNTIDFGRIERHNFVQNAYEQVTVDFRYETF